VLGATLEAGLGWLGNDAVNVLSCLVAAALAAALAGWV
jgi:uncharacterized membrane protein